MSVVFSKKEMDEMEKKLESFFNIRGITLTPPVDIFEVATSIGFDIRGAQFRDNLDGLVLVNENENKLFEFSTNKVIAYNRKKDIFAKKFIVGHELAHYIEEKQNNPNSKIIVAARDHMNGYSEDKSEQRKDYIAAAMLIPRDDLIKRYKDKKNRHSDRFIKKVADFYNVDPELAKRRMSEIFGNI